MFNFFQKHGLQSRVVQQQVFPINTVRIVRQQNNIKRQPSEYPSIDQSRFKPNKRRKIVYQQQSDSQYSQKSIRVVKVKRISKDNSTRDNQSIITKIIKNPEQRFQKLSNKQQDTIRFKSKTQLKNEVSSKQSVQRVSTRQQSIGNRPNDQNQQLSNSGFQSMPQLEVSVPISQKLYTLVRRYPNQLNYQILQDSITKFQRQGRIVRK